MIENIFDVMKMLKVDGIAKALAPFMGKELEFVPDVLPFYRYDNPNFMINGRKVLSPKVFMGMNIHGDESKQAGWVQTLARELAHDPNSVPSFLLVPYMSPSATSRATRENLFGTDIGRSFPVDVSDSNDSEVAHIISVYTREGPFDVVVLGHNSDERGSYVYVQTDLESIDAKVDDDHFRKTLNLGGMVAYNGPGNPYLHDDPQMDTPIINGVCRIRNWEELNEGNFIENWMLSRGARASITLEPNYYMSNAQFERYYFAVYQNTFLPTVRACVNN